MNYKFWILGTVAALALWKFLPEYPVEKVDLQLSEQRAVENIDSSTSAKREVGKIDEPCSAYKFWAESEDRKGLNEPLIDVKAPASLRRRAEYAKFLDSFWSSIDSQFVKKKPETVGDVFGDIQTAYVAASAQYGKVFRKLGVTTRLVVGDLFSSEDTEGDRFLTVHAMQNESLISDPVVQKRIAGTGREFLADSNTFDIGVRFVASPRNYHDMGVVEIVAATLSKDSPAISLAVPPKAHSGMHKSQVLRRVLTCTLK